MSERYFPNPYNDFNGEIELSNSNQLTPEANPNISHWIKHQADTLDQQFTRIDLSDATVYTGSAGIALLYLRLAVLFSADQDTYKYRAKRWIDSSLDHLKGKRISFLAGDPGPLAVAAVIYHGLNDQKMLEQCVNRIVSIKADVLNKSNSDEYLYGRAGYLYTLMYLRREIRADIIDKQLVVDIFEAMIKSGENYAKQSSSESPLMYQWHDNEYLGAAHGVSGIVFLLLQVAHDSSFPNLHSYIASHLIPTVDFLTTKRLPSGNYLSSSQSKSDKLVQWCHGAPGFVYLFVRTFEMTGKQSYLNLAIAAGDVVWERGLLRKGYALCHGTAGNGYVFLDLYRVTNDPKWLHRANAFSEHCLDYGKHDLSIKPDNPYSLFQGLAGTIHFLADVLSPDNARFPAFQ